MVTQSEIKSMARMMGVAPSQLLKAASKNLGKKGYGKKPVKRKAPAKRKAPVKRKVGMKGKGFFDWEPFPDFNAARDLLAKSMKGKGFFEDFGSGFVSGITLGAVRPGASKNIGFLPFGEKGFLGGVKPSQVAAVTGNPQYSAGLALVGQGKKRKGRKMIGGCATPIRT